MGDSFTFVIRFLHILSGVMWVGGIFLWGMVIAPRVMRKGPPAIRGPFLDSVLGGLSRYFNMAGALTIVTGFWTMGLLVGWGNVVPVFQGEMIGRGYGIALGLGVFLALAMVAEGLLVIQPTARRMLDVMKAMPAPVPGAAPAAPPAELAALGKRLGIASMVSLLLGTLALGAMAWAVNVFR